MKKVKITKELCKELTKELGNGYCIDDEGREMRLYHRSAKRNGLCFATYLADATETAHAIEAVIAAHKKMGVEMTKETIQECFSCFGMAVSHYVYGSPSVSAAKVLADDKKAKLAMGRGYFEGYNIPHGMKIVILNRCRKAFAEIKSGVWTDCEGGSYNSCKFCDFLKVA